MGFIILLILTTLSIAGSAAYFSVVGLARVFSGAFWSIIAMGCSLEAGKLVGASYLYRHWKDMSKVMRAYLLGAVVVLMGITSMGIFGYLSSAFQSNVLPYQQQQQQIVQLENDKSEAERLKTERMTREEEINKQIANLPNNFVRGRSRLMDANKAELEQIRSDVAHYTDQIRTDTQQIGVLKGKVLEETAHVGPIIFISQVFGADVNQATKWLIILLILVFDPLAVILTVGTNLAILKYKAEKNPAPEEPKELTVSTTTPVEEPPPVDPTESTFSKAHELFSNPNLTEHEKGVARTLEETIKRYLQTIGK
jgi:cell division protein FtsB